MCADFLHFGAPVFGAPAARDPACGLGVFLITKSKKVKTEISELCFLYIPEIKKLLFVKRLKSLLSRTRYASISAFASVFLYCTHNTPRDEGGYQHCVRRSARRVGEFICKAYSNYLHDGCVPAG